MKAKIISLSLISIVAVIELPAHAEVVFDHSSIVKPEIRGQKLSGTMVVPAHFGKQIGGNLFHSFQSFNIRLNESLEFTNAGARSAVHNIINRVTGDQASYLRGSLISKIPDANLYLLNPQGIIFGKEARLDLQGSFHASTATALSLGEKGLFDVFAEDMALLSSAPPQAFGFFHEVSTANELITVNGSELVIINGNTFDLTAGAIHINDATMNAASGKINLHAQQGVGWFDEFSSPTEENAGAININKSLIDVSGDGGGTIHFWGKTINVIDTAPLPILYKGIFADNTGNLNATADKGVILNGYDILLRNSLISADAYDLNGVNTGNAGNITVNAHHQLNMKEGGQLKSDVYAKGNAGDIRINTPSLMISGQSDNRFTGIYSNTYSGSSGHAGVITVNAANIAIRNHYATETKEQNVGIFSNAYDGSYGNAATIRVNAGDIDAYAESTAEQDQKSFVGIFSTTRGDDTEQNDAQGNAGNIEVHANQAVRLNKENSQAFIGIFSKTFTNDHTTSHSQAGSVIVSANFLKILRGAFISSSTNSFGHAGNIEAIANHLHIDGNNSKFLTGIISTAEKNKANAGNLLVRSQSLELLNGGQISSTAYAQGDAGRVEVISNQLTIDGRNHVNPTGILSDTSDQNPQGNANTVQVSAKRLTILNGGQIGSNSRTLGNAGSVTVTADQLTIDAQHNEKTGIFSVADTNSNGNGGDITVRVSEETVLNHKGQINSSLYGSGASGGRVLLTSPQLTMLNDAEISAFADSSNQQAVGGSIAIQTDQLILDRTSRIKANNQGLGDAGAIRISAKDRLSVTHESEISVASASGDAGDVQINVGNVVYLLDSKLTTTAAEGEGNGGDILFNAAQPTQFAVLNNSQIIAKARAGNGGNIKIYTDFYLPSAESVVNASSDFGLEGQVSISSANSNIAGSIAVLPSLFNNSSALLQDECLPQSKQNASSFTAFSMHGAVLASPENVLNYLPSSLSQCSKTF